MKIKNKKIDVQPMGQHLVVFYKDEILFKVSTTTSLPLFKIAILSAKFSASSR